MAAYSRRAYAAIMSSLRPPLRDAAIAAATDGDRGRRRVRRGAPARIPAAYFTGGHHLPHTPDAAFLLVIVAGAVLAWRHRYPLLVLVISTAAVVVYSLLGYVNGVALLLPAVALGTAAAMWPIRRSVAWAVATHPRAHGSDGG